MKKGFKPYYAVIFTSKQTETLESYEDMALKMVELAKQQKGFIGMESVRNDTSASLSGALGIAVSYWESLEAIKIWKANTEHQLAQIKGKTDWYSWYHVRICKVEREYEFEN